MPQIVERNNYYGRKLQAHIRFKEKSHLSINHRNERLVLNNRHKRRNIGFYYFAIEQYKRPITLIKYKISSRSRFLFRIYYSLIASDTQCRCGDIGDNGPRNESFDIRVVRS